ncbi:MAG: NAD-dependent protein deacylase [Betaproteobacteria bacterium]
MKHAMENTLHEIADTLRDCRRVLFITGAGVSADSGLPTYRGVGGLYNSGETEEGLAIEEVLSGECFAVRPDLTWKYLAQIQHNCHAVQPNPAHQVIADLEQRLEVVVLTQNIDGLHLKAGSSDVIEIHGTLDECFCTECGKEASAVLPEVLEAVPRCDDCGGVVRPRVVLFGESLPEQAMRRLYGALDEEFGMVFLIGTTAVFPYIAEPVVMAVRAGVPTVEINPARTRMSEHVDYYLPLGAAEALTAIHAAMQIE